MYTDFRDRCPVFSGVLARFASPVSVGYRGQTERAEGELVSGNFFEVLGVKALIGRTFTQDDDRIPGAHPVVFLSYGYWQRRFGGDRAIVNQTVLINGHPMTVLGVGPPGFQGVQVGHSTEVMVPMMMKAMVTPIWNEMDERRSLWLQAMARLKPGVSPQQAEAAANVLYHQVLQQEVKEITGWPQRAVDRFVRKRLFLLRGRAGQPSLEREYQAPLTLLMSMVGLVLLIACANVANLLMARSAARQREIAIRVAVGAGRSQIMRQLLVESLLLAGCGGLAGLLVAAWAGDLLLTFMPPNGFGSGFTTAPDGGVLAFNFALSILAGLLFGLFPAWQSARTSVATILKDQAASVSGGTSHVRFRKALVVAQIALSLLLLIGAGLLTRSLYNLRSLDPGFHTENLLTFSLDASINGYAQPRIRDLYARLQEEISQLPGVRAVSMAEIGPLTGNRSMSTITVEGYKAKEEEDMNPDDNWVGPGYFSTMGIPLVAGREFTRRDVFGGPKVAVVNETMAHYYVKKENPLGRRFGFGGRKGKPEIEIVGVVKDGKGQGLREEPRRFIYVPYTQDKGLQSITYYVRTGDEPEQISGALRRVVQQMDPNLPVFDMKSMQTQVSESLFAERLIAALSAGFGFLATLLAAIGLYGVMAYTVARRTREIGIRMALGAAQRSVVWLVLRDVAFMAAIGVAVGLPVALALSRFIRSQLFGLAPTDPLTMALAVVALCTVALLAGYIPAQRATRVDPVKALRYE